MVITAKDLRLHLIKRYSQNPIITRDQVLPSRADFEVTGVFNPGAAVRNGKVMLLLRVSERPLKRQKGYLSYAEYDPENRSVAVRRLDLGKKGVDTSDARLVRAGGRTYLTSISHLRLAESRDGIHFTVSRSPAIAPSDAYEAFGTEDARITQVGKRYLITYSAVSSGGVAVAVSSTEDFQTYRKLGIAFPPDNKDTVVFPQKIGSLYYALHRPSCSDFASPEIWMAESPDLIHWGRHRFIAGVRDGMWDCTRIGAGAPPFLTEKGWVELYHGASENSRYCMGAMLLQKDKPWNVLARSRKPLIEPEAPYERSGFFGNVVFGCGTVRRGNSVFLYYGASDESVAVLSMDLKDIYSSLGI